MGEKESFVVTKDTVLSKMLNNRDFNPELVSYLRFLVQNHLGITIDARKSSDAFNKTIAQLAEERGILEAKTQTFLQEANRAIQGYY